MQTTPAELSALLAILASIIANYLKSDGMAAWKNATIAAAALVVFGILTAWLTNGFTSDLRGSILVVIGIIVALASNELHVLLVFIQGLPLPTMRARATTSVRPTAQSWPPRDGNGGQGA